MRDEMVGRMVSQINQGDIVSVAEGCSEFFSILEAMKLESRIELESIESPGLERCANKTQRDKARKDPRYVDYVESSDLKFLYRRNCVSNVRYEGLINDDAKYSHTDCL
jgi:hypothetical protein